MRHLALAGILSALISSHSAAADADRYGPTESLSGIYFTNFENSVFVPCTGKACDDWVRSKGYNLWCDKAACDELDSKVSALNGSPQRWGLFAISLEGRRSLSPHEPRHMYDRGQSLKLERIKSFALIKGDQSAGQ